MEKGDISNRAAPRVVFVWENLLAHLPDEKVGAEERLLKRRKWTKALDLWVSDTHVRHMVNEMWTRWDLAVDVLCTHPAPFAQRLRFRLDGELVTYGHLYNYSLLDFDKELAFLPNVLTVYHGEVTRPFLFGGRGQLVAGVGA